MPITPGNNEQLSIKALSENNKEVKLNKSDVIEKLLIKEYEENIEYDIAGVIYIEDFVFSIVMNPTLDDFYLDHSREGKSLSEGELFLSDKSNFNPENKSLDMTRIYGHAQASGSRFGLLSRMMNVNNKRDMYFYDGDKIRMYEMAVAMEFEDGSVKIENYDLDISQKETFIENLIRDAEIRHLKDIDYSKEIVFLQTCQTWSGLDRYLMMFVEVDNS